MEKKMNNKGFSMVELIIVIAIMAVLVVVAAPQYLKYVERGRNSTDQNNATAMESALLVWASDTDATPAFAASKTGEIVVSSTNNVAVSGDLSAAITAALNNAHIDMTTRCQSKSKWTSYKLDVSSGSDGTVTVTISYLP